MKHRLITALLAVPLPALASTFERFDSLPGHGSLGAYVSTAQAPQQAVITLHGYPRDARRTFDATVAAVAPDTLVLAPLFQVPAGEAEHCHSPAEPAAQAGDLLWRCGSWLAGAPAENDRAVTAFAAVDALIAQVGQRWPSVKVVTVAGFSAGAQWVQHYAAFAQQPPAGGRLRFVVASPGSWLYPDTWRPYPQADCPAQNHWKYGLEQLPGWLPQGAEQARAQYRAADISYLAGALDHGDSPAAHGKILDRSCPALAQGPWRLQRAQAFTEHLGQPLQVVPGCAHDVRCVFGSAQGRQALAAPPAG
ncbi:hypothetical protein [Pseudomonas typographi]|uniref:hypothetical protein n=1 Tax=Pseudomonas typographi TaxID=2715964 RepID=UPI0016891ED7|nr:hypothetical protein [Pseudomonas typographi]MBD1551726.1 hypothetical protein [Pseudomonas typographi]